MKTILDKAAIIKLKKEGFSSRKIEKLTGISRNTINKIWKNYQDDLNSITAKDVKSNIHELTDRIVKGSSYDSSNRGPRKYNLEIETALRKILDDEEKKTQRLGKNHKQKLTEKQIYELIVSQGFDIGKTTICNRIKEIRDEIKETFIKQDYEYCDRFEYDFGEVKLFIAGECIKGYLAVMTSPASHFRWAYLYTNMKMEVFIDSHARFFELVGGSFKEGVYDNCRCVVSKFIGRNMKELNPELIKLSLYYDYQINVTNCFSGNEKGSVESAVKWIRNKVFASKYEFESFEEAENYLQNRLIEINKNSDIEEEKKYLKPYRPMYESSTITENRVDKYAFIRVDGNWYSVPDSLSEKKVLVKSYPNKIEVYYKGKQVASHSRLIGKEKTCIDIRHYLHTLEKKPGALKNSLALKSNPELKKLFDTYYKDKPKTFIDLLRKNKELSTDEIIRNLTPKNQQMQIQERVDEKAESQINELMKLFTGGQRVYH
ncbi:MAG: IS21 family transposase [Erysipelotrichaceae bacterium]|nr:IS21 family transposase [Erysipelotrichaceae bacterium]